MTERESQCIEEAYLRYTENLQKLVSIYYKPDQVEDIVQDAFAIACTKPEALLSSADQEAWLIRTVRNVIRNQRRADGRWNKITIPLNSWSETASPCDIENALRLPKHVDGIKDRDLLLFYRVVLYNESVEDVSKQLRITTWACRKRLERTRKKLEKWSAAQKPE